LFDLFPFALELDGPQAGIDELIGHGCRRGPQLSGEDLLGEPFE
jgi:hypothetical protein